MVLTFLAGLILEVVDNIPQHTDHEGGWIGLGLMAIAALEAVLRRFTDPEAAAA